MKLMETYQNVGMISMRARMEVGLERPVLLWVSYEPTTENGNRVVKIILRGLENPLPFNGLTTDMYGSGRLHQWLEDRGWKRIGQCQVR